MIFRSKTLVFFLLTVVCCSTGFAFQGELFSQAILALDSPSVSSLDEFFFAAANLLDSRQPASPGRLYNNGGLSSFTAVSRLLMRPPPPYVFDKEDNYHYDDDAQPVSRTIFLTKEEQNLFQLVRQVREKYCPNTTIRIAGGWVRDKLLGKQASHDIDFVLNNKSGIEFAKHFQEYLMEHQNNDLVSSDIPLSSATAVAEASLKEYGAKSKHLQTASIEFGDFSIDFCQLRFEKYSQGSRVPEETGIASAVEDAWRRDLTINSLFFNVNTNQVEDWTEQGLQDLQLRNIATPRAPLSTLLQDPLRILRAIRFAAQLSFSMDSRLKKAAMEDKVRHALQQKVSKDRMGNEIDAMFRTPDPVRGVRLLLETSMVDIVFPLQDNLKSLKLQEEPSTIYQAGYRLLFRTQSLASRIFVKPGQWDISKRQFLWYAAFFTPFCNESNFSGQQKAGGGKKSRRDGSMVYQLLTQGLKRPASDSQSVESIIRGVDMLSTFLPKLDNDATVQNLLENDLRFAALSKGDQEWEQIADLRWQAYQVLKQVGPLWKEALLLILAASGIGLPEAAQRFQQCVTLLEDRLGLDDGIFNKMYSKPLLNGSQIQELALPGVSGEAFRHIMAAQEEWQVRHGCSGADHHDNNKKDQEEALIEHLVRNFSESTSCV